MTELFRREKFIKKQMIRKRQKIEDAMMEDVEGALGDGGNYNTLELDWQIIWT